MKFLSTNNKLDILEADEYRTIEIDLPGELFDLPCSQLKAHLADCCGFLKTDRLDDPLLLSVKISDCSDEEIVYFVDLLLVYFMKLFTTKTKKFKEDLWQPRFAICNSLILNRQAQNQILNYESLLKAFNIQFINDKDQVLIDIFSIEKEGEK